jgi:DnaJ-class molecular chaperone
VAPGEKKKEKKKSGNNDGRDIQISTECTFNVIVKSDKKSIRMN